MSYSQNLENIKTREYPVTIAASGTTSAEIDLKGGSLVGIRCAAAFTGTTITVQSARVGGGTYATAYKADGSAMTLTHVNNAALAISPTDTAPLRLIKLFSNGTEASARTLYVIVRSID